MWFLGVGSKDTCYTAIETRVWILAPTLKNPSVTVHTCDLSTVGQGQIGGSLAPGSVRVPVRWGGADQSRVTKQDTCGHAHRQEVEPLPHQLFRPLSELRDFACLALACALSARATDGCCRPSLALYTGAGDLNSAPQACAASTEPSPQPGNVKSLPYSRQSYDLELSEVFH